MIGFGQSCKSLELISMIKLPQYPLVSGSPVPLEFSAEFTIEFWIKTQHNLRMLLKFCTKTIKQLLLEAQMRMVF